MSKGQEENLRLIKLLIERLTVLEHRFNAVVDCIDNIETAVSAFSSVFDVLKDDLRDDHPHRSEQKKEVKKCH